MAETKDGRYFDRGGNPISAAEWADRFERMEERRVDLTELPYGEVSTVWLGLNHAFGGGPPLIFETMVFARNSRADLDAERYCSLGEARAGHEAMVTKWREKPESAWTTERRA